jgi:pimeloyl-ACP methyl ester carboxylesterase
MRLATFALFLGISVAGCASPPAAVVADTRTSSCLDSTPHTSGFVTVAPDVRLEVLDWGGSGEPMVLLTGLGDTAHVYDDFAFQWTDFYHVIGITRRGYGLSSKPSNGYDIATRAKDDVKVLDALGIGRALFVGHSIAGEELSRLGSAYADRVDKLVYLDAYDYADRFKLKKEIPGAPYVESDFSSVYRLNAASARLEGVRRPISAICQTYRVDSTPINLKIIKGVGPRVDYTKILAPRLGIFAIYSRNVYQPWYPYLSGGEKTTFRANWPALVDWQADALARFNTYDRKGTKPNVFTLPSAPHYIYINNESFVVRQMRAFLGLPL